MVVKGALPRQMLTHSRGIISYRTMADGRVIAQKWPRRRRGPLPMVTQQQVALWDMVQEMVKRPLASDFVTAVEDTGGTAFYPRDVLIMACYGNYLAWPGAGWAADDPIEPE